MNLFRSFSIYTIAGFLNRGIGFVLAPILSYFLSKEDIGILAIFNSYIIISSVFIGLGAKAAISVKYFQLEKKDFPHYFTAALIGPGLIFALFLLLAIIFNRPLAQLIEIPPVWVIILACTALFQVLNELCLALFRVEDRASSFAWYSIGLSVLNFGISLILIIAVGMNWEGRALGMVSSYGIFALIAMVVFFRKDLLTTYFRKDFIKAALIFGIPLIPHLVGTFIIEYSDRIFLQKMVGKAELGVYDMGYKIGMSIQILVTAFSLTFGPFLFESLKKLTAERKLEIVRISYLFIGGLLVAIFLLKLISPFIFTYLIDDKFIKGDTYVFWVALGYFFFGCYSLFANYIHYSGKTYIFSFLAILNVAANLILNYYLILRYGAIGAAYATIISYFLIFIITAFIANRLYPMPWFKAKVFEWKEWKDMLRQKDGESGR